ncbi:MAG: AAA family ATPase [Treponema sp.]|nr:AAA family ATPase [Treponema sp.]
MTAAKKTSLRVASNLYILKPDENGKVDPPGYQYEFLSKIKDFVALKKLRDTPFLAYELSEIQNEILRATTSCAYASRNDFQWGSVYDTNGDEKVICKCIKIECECFNDCRDDFDVKELDVLAENKKKYIYYKYIPPVYDKHIDENNNSDIVFFEGDQIDEQAVQNIDIPSVILNLITDKEVKNESHGYKTVEQNHVIKMNITERSIVNAGPGTGKTWVIIQKLKHIIETTPSDQIDETLQSILVLCFTRAAVEVIQTRLKQMSENDQWRKIEVISIDSFATSLIAWIIGKEKYNLLPGGSTYRLEANDYDSRISTAETIFKKNTEKDIIPRYKHIIIDEIQDLVEPRSNLILELLEAVSQDCGFTVFGDSCQAIYDYLGNSNTGFMTSARFYGIFLNKFNDILKLSFEKNWRQQENIKLQKLTKPYREAILENENDKSRNFEVLDNIYSDIKRNIHEVGSSKEIYRWSLSNINSIKSNGTLGILTRNNGIALLISTWLDNNRIEHNFPKPSDCEYVHRWIADIFVDYGNDIITEDIFLERYFRLFPNATTEIAREYWIALTEKAKGNIGHYDVKNILKSLYSSKNNLIFAGKENLSGITVSTIHKAKGKEFDTVLLIDVNEDNYFDNDENNELLEHKIRYVALTRPKKMLMKHMLKDEYKYIYRDTLKNKRCSKACPAKERWKKGLSHIEIGLNNDLDIMSFKTFQDYISKDLQRLDRLFLKFNPKADNYYIIPEKRPSIRIGRTGPEFTRGITRAQRRMWTTNWNIKNLDEKLPKNYPSGFDEIFVDDIITCISSSLDFKLGEFKTFGEVSIWYGFSVRGFAHKDNDRF